MVWGVTTNSLGLISDGEIRLRSFVECLLLTRQLTRSCIPFWKLSTCSLTVWRLESVYLRRSWLHGSPTRHSPTGASVDSTILIHSSNKPSSFSIICLVPSNSPSSYGRVETLSGFANGVFLILISIFIVFEAIQRMYVDRLAHDISPTRVITC